MALTLAVLNTELRTDPRGYGYAPHIAAGATVALAEMLNLPRDGTSVINGTVPGPAISVNRGTIATQELVEAVVQSEMPSNAAQRDWLIMVASGARVRVDTNSTARAGLLAIFGAATTTRANLTTASSRVGSRAEELFGTNVTVSAADVAAALAS